MTSPQNWRDQANSSANVLRRPRVGILPEHSVLESGPSNAPRRHGAQERVARTGSEIRRTHEPRDEPVHRHLTIDETPDFVNGLSGLRPNEYATQWRPNIPSSTPVAQNDVNAAMLRALQELTNKIGDIRINKKDDPDILFTGAETEEPQHYITQMQDWLTENEIPPAKIPTYIRKTLKGEALKWFQEEVAYETDWDMFTQYFLSRFNSKPIIAGLVQKLFGQPQAPGEPVARFITTKWALFRRVAPEVPEVLRVSIIQEQLLNTIRAYTRTRTYENIQQLIETASGVEGDVIDQLPTRSATRGPTPRAAVPTPSARTPAVVTATTPARANNPSDPPSPCRHCGGNHFNRNCPTLAQPAVNSSASVPPTRQPSENPQRANVGGNVRPINHQH